MGAESMGEKRTFGSRKTLRVLKLERPQKTPKPFVPSASFCGFRDPDVSPLPRSKRSRLPSRPCLGPALRIAGEAGQDRQREESEGAENRGYGQGGAVGVQEMADEQDPGRERQAGDVEPGPRPAQSAPRTGGEVRAPPGQRGIDPGRSKADDDAKPTPCSMPASPARAPKVETRTRVALLIHVPLPVARRAGTWRPGRPPRRGWRTNRGCPIRVSS